MAEEPSKGWIVHSSGRRFGPLTEDELRHYFQAGMVKSVDRITAPGAFAMEPAAVVAEQLGERAPVGPPPPDLESEIAPPPAEPPPPHSLAEAAQKAQAAQAQGEKPLDPRAMEAIAKMQLELATSREQRARRRGGYTGPLIIVVALIALMLVALSMLKKMKPPAAATEGPSGYEEPAQEAMVPPGQPAAPRTAVSPSVPAESAPPERAAHTGDADFQASFQRADLLKSARQWPALIEHARLWAQHQPERTEPWQFLGVAYAAQENYTEAAAAFNRVLRQDPGNNAVRQSLADVYLGAKRYPEAADLYAKLVATNPNDARMWNNYGMSLRSIGQTAQAVAALETAVRLDPNFKQAWTNLGQTYQQIGDDNRATAAFANAK